MKPLRPPLNAKSGGSISGGERSNASEFGARVAQEAMQCERCPLHFNATQLVFGEGPAPATILIVGEQPGDQEDRAGRPIVGSAGRVLDQALDEVGLDRGSVYVTNAVKNFKHEQRVKRRLHKQPNRSAGACPAEARRCAWRHRSARALSGGR
jgi:uracil-DNA glycosylase